MRAAVLALAVAAASPAYAQTLNVETSLSDREVLVGDVVTMSVVATAEANGSIDLSLPRVDGLTELSQSRGESTSMSIMGATRRVTRQLTLRVEYQADKPGTITIGPVKGQLGSIRAQSEPLILLVKDNQALKEQTTTAQANQISPPASEERQLFLRYVVNQSEVFVGQEVLLDLEIFAHPRFNFSLEDGGGVPELDGFWKEILQQPQRLSRRNVNIGGQTYHAYRVWRVGLYPLEAGEPIIAPMAMTFTKNTSIFGGGTRFRRRTPPIKLLVKPLPTEGRPRGFSNANVGQYTLAARVDNATVKAGKAVLLTVELSGLGNIKNTRLPEVKELDGFRVFPPNVKDDVKTTASGLKGKKQAEILLMPQRGGRLEIPGVQLSIFDPIAAEYRTLTTPSIRVAVQGDPTATEAASASPATPPATKSTKLARDQLRPLRFRSTLEPPASPPWTRTYLAGLILPPLIFLLVWFGEGLLARARRETPASQKKMALRHARVRLSQAQTHAEAGRLREAYSAFAQALLDYGSERTGVTLQGLTTDDVGRALRDRGAEDPLVDAVVQELESADFVRYAGGTISSAQAQDMVARWENILSDLETFEPEETAS